MDYRRTFCRRSNRDQEPPMNIFMIEYYIFLEIFFKVCGFRPQGKLVLFTIQFSYFKFKLFMKDGMFLRVPYTVWSNPNFTHLLLAIQ